MYTTGHLLMALCAGFLAGALGLFYVALAQRRRAIRLGIARAGPMPASGCSDEQWN